MGALCPDEGNQEAQEGAHGVRQGGERMETALGLQGDLHMCED